MAMPTDTREPSTRPTLHFTAPYGWLNDPCGPGYDPVTGRYHLFYQWNPQSCEWGNISWGHATSTDLVTWEQDSPEPALKPDTVYDKDGVFTGCFYATGLHGEKDQLSLVYSSISRLPVHWTLPHSRASEGIAAATSSDGGRTWTKWQDNPLLREEPEGVDVTGWRDPYISQWESLDRILGKSSSLYGVVSGGVRDKGPAVFLYSIQPDDLTKWRYLGTIIDLPKHFKQSPKWSGDLGVNLECATFITLRSADGRAFEFCVAGSEGGVERDWITEYLAGKPETHPRRTVRYCNWLSGRLEESKDGGATLRPDFSGLFDHGCLYAINTFRDASGRQIAWGWIPEEDVPIEFCKGKGWNGCLSLPRELFLQRISNVTGALHSPLDSITSIWAEQESDGAFTVYTLGVRPLPDLQRICFGKPQTWNNVSLPAWKEGKTIKSIGPTKGRTWKLEATVEVGDGCTEVGVHIRHTADRMTGNVIAFRPREELIVVDREESNGDPKINKFEERGPFTLFTLAAGDAVTREKLKLEVFFDGHVVEVFACGRFALTTMMYADDPDAASISLFAEGESGSAVFESVEIFNG